MTSEAKPGRWKALLVPGVPFLLSMGLSLSTVGSNVFWQDSGLYLTGVKELGVLYPPGFATYLILCKAWTLLFFFLDYTLAVHLFSASFGALTAGTLAVAARDFLRTRGPLFRSTPEDPGRLAEAAGIVAGCLAAAGFTFWFTSIYAKGYTLYYFVLALLLWRMIRADESGKGRDFTIVAVLIGLSWQVHPSAALLGLAFLLYVFFHRKVVGWGGIVWRTGVAAACAVGPSLILLPIFVAREPFVALGEPKGLWALLRYVSGRRFLTIPDVFGYDSTRAASFGQYFWEEFLGIGLVLVTAGLAILVKQNRRLLIGIAAWLIPFTIVTILFKLEGQHDCWFVAAWMPLYLAAAAGACAPGRKVGRHAVPALAACGLIALGWAALLNRPLLDNRAYILPELFGRTYLDHVDRDAVLVMYNDDPIVIVEYLQRVKGRRPDIAFVRGPFLYMAPTADRDWYDQQILKRYPFLRMPDYPALERRFPGAYIEYIASAAFLNANAECGRPLFCNFRAPPEMIRPDYALVPAGALWKLVRREDQKVDLRYWQFPIEPEEVRLKYRRERGQFVRTLPGQLMVKPESYERRFLRMLLHARRNLGEWLSHNRNHEQAVRVFESILRLDAEPLKEAEFAYCYAASVYGIGEFAKAEPFLRRALDLATFPERRSSLLLYLAKIYRGRKCEDQARQYFEAALSVPGIDPATRTQIQEEWNKP